MSSQSIWGRRKKRAQEFMARVAGRLPTISTCARQEQAETGKPTSETEFAHGSWFLPTQLAWINDTDPLRLWEKGRQIGATRTDAFDSVMKASPAGAKFDVWVTSRDELQATLYLEDCK